VRETPALATYILDKYEQPVAQLDDNPLAAYRKGADDLITALRRRATPRFGIEWAHEIALVKDAIRRSLELGEEISLDGLS
ncbi:hypothetical protein KDL45_18190, partial [bacterium]|nr:hypothetical protein [bacterium]